MCIQIIGDSCTDLTEEMKKEGAVELVPLTIELEDQTITDDTTFNRLDFIRRMAQSPKCPKSACPSPATFIDRFSKSAESFVITLSSKLSGSFQSGKLACEMYMEEHKEAKIEVIDSKSASIGQTLIAMKLRELADRGLSFQEIKERIHDFRDHLHTKFVLETLENLRKNGRLSNLKAAICNVLNIKPVMAGEDGTIVKLDQARGMERALRCMIDHMLEDVGNAREKILGIAHCNNKERAVSLRDKIMERIPFRDSVIVETNGISTLYANDGGIIVAY